MLRTNIMEIKIHVIVYSSWIEMITRLAESEEQSKRIRAKSQMHIPPYAEC